MTDARPVLTERRAAARVGHLDDPRVFEDLFEHAPSGYLALTPDGRVVRSNRQFADWVGADGPSLVGRRFTDLLTVAGRVYYETHLAPMLRLQGRFDEVALDFTRAEGDPLPGLVSAVERRDTDDRPFAIWLTVFKAVDRRRYEAELLAAREELRRLSERQAILIDEAVAAREELAGTLRQSQKMEVVGQLTAGLAHDFNNVLSGVSGAFEMMDRRIAQGRGDEVAPYVRAGREALRRATALIARLLAFSRKQEAVPGIVDIDPVITSLEDIARRIVGSTISLRLGLAAHGVRVRVDANQLEAALLNLCVNARDAMEAGGTLSIETFVDDVGQAQAEALGIQVGRHVVLSVADTGSGMSDEVATRVLEPFFTTKEEGRGTGLGLTMVAEFTRQSHGGLRIETALGHGTTIFVYLPQANEVESD